MSFYSVPGIHIPEADQMRCSEEIRYYSKYGFERPTISYIKLLGLKKIEILERVLFDLKITVYRFFYVFANIFKIFNCYLFF